MAHYEQPGWKATNFTPVIEYKTSDGPLTHKENVVEKAFEAVNFTPTEEKIIAGDGERIDATPYCQPDADRKPEEVHHRQTVSAPQNPVPQQYFQPGGPVAATYDPTQYTQDCPYCGSAARIVGSAFFAWRCSEGHAFTLNQINVQVPFLNNSQFSFAPVITMGDEYPKGNG
jgi:hypothetical protein